MTIDGPLFTSPFLFLHGQRDDVCCQELISGQRYKSVSLKSLGLLYYFLEGVTIDQSLSDGWALEDILEGLNSGLLQAQASSEFQAATLWEKRNWSRAAFLAFSQVNLEYEEPLSKDSHLEELTEFRRSVVQRNLMLEAYPSPAKFFVAQQQA